MNGIGTVVELDGERAKVRVAVSGECGSCAAKSHCHGASRTSRILVAMNAAHAAVGDTVTFEAHGGRVVLSAALIWIVPILSMIVGYLVGERFGSGIIPIAAAFGFLALTFVLLKLFDRMITGGSSFYPEITAVHDSAPESPSGCHE